MEIILSEKAKTKLNSLNETKGADKFFRIFIRSFN